MRTSFYLSAAVVLSAASGVCQASAKPIDSASPKGTAIFKPDWDNIASHYQCPEWFQDAKFGIFIHWGVYSVPAIYNEWHARKMYEKKSPEYGAHKARFGPQNKFGYKDFIPKFTAEKFDADEWMKLFKDAGAKYVVPVAEHHDGFSMYDSGRNEWNAVKMGPKRDVIGLLKKAADKEGIIFGLSSHRLENSWFFNSGLGHDTDVNADKEKKIGLYGFRLPGVDAYQKKFDYPDYVGEDFLLHTRELIDKYQPQLIWFDWTVSEIKPWFNQFLAYYYNNALDWKKGVVVNTKQGYPNNVQVSDIERGLSKDMRKYPWQTDTSVGNKSWGFVYGESNKSSKKLVRDLVDIVSKNGNLLLNIGPGPDGVITDKQKNVLLDIGKWLKVNGEAIYGTRPWFKFGEGPTKVAHGTFTDGKDFRYTAEDIRFTTKNKVLYAIVLNWGKTITVKSLDKNTIADAKLLDVSLLGSKEKLKWTLTDAGLQVIMPEEEPCDSAYTLKISFDQAVGAHLPSEAVDVPFKQGI
ncbi:MAG: alpha-L-fucosidase [Puniceicoccales bacterium]|jgi:alpha-L-fucosidase|nr:alpha-L-fucosidase [Puniceicoccales bacterium]